MSRLHPLLRSLLLPALACPVVAQQDLPPKYWRSASACSRGTVVLGADGIWIAPRGEPFRALAAAPEGGVHNALATERGIVLDGEFGVARVPWDKSGGPAEVHAPPASMALVAAGEVVLAIDDEQRPWSLAADGSWVRGAAVLPGGTDALTGQLLAGHGGRWVRATTTKGRPAPGEDPDSAPDDYACFWSEDLATWHAAVLPADFERAFQSASELSVGAGLCAVHLGEGRLLVSKDGERWERAATPALHDPSIEGFVVVGDNLLVLDQASESRGRLHGRTADGTWATRELAEGATIQHLFAGGDGVLAIGQRGASEPPQLLPLQAFFEEWTPEPLPPCASLRWVHERLPLVGLRTVSDRIIADFSGVLNHDGPYPFTLERNGWRMVYRQEQPELCAAALGAPPASASAKRACHGDSCASIDADGRLLLSTTGAPSRTTQLEGGRRFRSIAHGAGQWAALDGEGRLLLSRDAATWRPATSDTLRFEHLAGNSTELVATTSSLQVLTWRCAADSPPNGAAETTADVERFPSVRETVAADLGPVLGKDAFWDARFDGTTLAFLVDDALLLSGDGVDFRRVRVSEGPLPMRLQLAAHGGKLWTIQWRDESTDAVSKVKSSVRWHAPDGSVEGMHTFLNEVVFDAASDGRTLAVLGSSFGTNRIGAWIDWTADGGKTWGCGLPEVEVQPLAYDASGAKSSVGGIAHGNGLWVVAGWSKDRSNPRAAVAVSRDLVKWETRLLPDAVGAPHTLRHAQGRFVALAREAKGKGVDVLVSADGKDWKVQRLPDMPGARLAIGRERLYLHSGATVLASDDASTWREVVAPRIEPSFMAEIEGMLCYAAAEPSTQAARLRFVRTPAPSRGVHAAAQQRFGYEPGSMADSLRRFKNLVEGLRYDRQVYVELDKHLAEASPLGAADAKALVLALFEKRRTPNMIYRLAEVVASEPVRKATRELLTTMEQSTLRAYSEAVQVRRGHLAEKAMKTPAPPEAGKIRPRPGAQFDVGRAHERYAQGSAGAAYDLAIVFAEGRGVEQDMGRARTYGELAVKRLGSEPSMDQLAAAGSITGLLATAIDDYQAGRYSGCADKLWTAIDMNAYIAMSTAASLCVF